jgi:MFS family permease
MPARTTARPLAAYRTGAAPRSVLTIWLGWLWLMAGINMAAPLYAVYAQKFGFSSLVLTLVFATYAAALVPSLLLCGRLSDRYGRRPVILAGLAAAAVGLLLLALAQGTWWLFVARGFQGLAVGLVSGPATAALVELAPVGSRQRPALLAGLAQAGGCAVGPMLAGALAQWAPAPLVLTYLVGLAGLLVAGAATLAVPEPGEVSGEPWRVQLPRIPRDIAADVARVGLTAAIAWASVALYLSVVPTYVATLLDTDNLALVAAVSAAALAASCVGQVVSERLPLPVARAQAVALAMLAVGLVALAVAGPTASLAVLLTGAAVTGAGHGLGFLNAQHELNDIAPAERRGEVTAAFICCIYALVGGAVIATGLLDLGLSFNASLECVSVVLALTAAGAAAWQAGAARTAARVS